MRILTTALLAAGAFAAAAAPAGAQQDVCVTYDFAGSEFCVIAETQEAAATGTALANRIVQDEVWDRCVTYDFAGSKICVGDLRP